jgi:hypothetical protein
LSIDDGLAFFAISLSGFETSNAFASLNFGSVLVIAVEPPWVAETAMAAVSAAARSATAPRSGRG